jgi:hypothetical protein
MTDWGQTANSSSSDQILPPFDLSIYTALPPHLNFQSHPAPRPHNQPITRSGFYNPTSSSGGVNQGHTTGPNGRNPPPTNSPPTNSTHRPHHPQHFSNIVHTVTGQGIGFPHKVSRNEHFLFSLQPWSLKNAIWSRTNAILALNQQLGSSLHNSRMYMWLLKDYCRQLINNGSNNSTSTTNHHKNSTSPTPTTPDPSSPMDDGTGNGRNGVGGGDLNQNGNGAGIGGDDDAGRDCLNGQKDQNQVHNTSLPYPNLQSFNNMVPEKDVYMQCTFSHMNYSVGDLLGGSSDNDGTDLLLNGLNKTPSSITNLNQIVSAQITFTTPFMVDVERLGSTTTTTTTTTTTATSHQPQHQSARPIRQPMVGDILYLFNKIHTTMIPYEYQSDDYNQLLLSHAPQLPPTHLSSLLQTLFQPTTTPNPNPNPNQNNQLLYGRGNGYNNMPKTLSNSRFGQNLGQNGPHSGQDGISYGHNIPIDLKYGQGGRPYGQNQSPHGNQQQQQQQPLYGYGQRRYGGQNDQNHCPNSQPSHELPLVKHTLANNLLSITSILGEIRFPPLEDEVQNDQNGQNLGENGQEYPTTNHQPLTQFTMNEVWSSPYWGLCFDSNTTMDDGDEAFAGNTRNNPKNNQNGHSSSTPLRKLTPKSPIILPPPSNANPLECIVVSVSGASSSSSSSSSPSTTTTSTTTTTFTVAVNIPLNVLITWFLTMTRSDVNLHRDHLGHIDQNGQNSTQNDENTQDPTPTDPFITWLNVKRSHSTTKAEMKWYCSIPMVRCGEDDVGGKEKEKNQDPPTNDNNTINIGSKQQSQIIVPKSTPPFLNSKSIPNIAKYKAVQKALSILQSHQYLGPTWINTLIMNVFNNSYYQNGIKGNSNGRNHGQGGQNFRQNGSKLTQIHTAFIDYQPSSLGSATAFIPETFEICGIENVEKNCYGLNMGQNGQNLGQNGQDGTLFGLVYGPNALITPTPLLEFTKTLDQCEIDDHEEEFVSKLSNVGKNVSKLRRFHQRFEPNDSQNGQNHPKLINFSALCSIPSLSLIPQTLAIHNTTTINSLSMMNMNGFNNNPHVNPNNPHHQQPHFTSPPQQPTTRNISLATPK